MPESEWDEIRNIAESHAYIEHIIDKHSFVISFKSHTGFTGPLNVSAFIA